MAMRLRIVSGKGGVGKSTVAAALALAEAQAGKRVLVAEVHGANRVARLLEVPPTGSEIREVLPRIHLVDMNPADAIHEYALMILRFEAIYRVVFENKLVKNFIRLIPSLGEMVMLGKVWFHEQELLDERPRFDVIILDAPATGHAISLLRTPSVIETTVPAGPLRQSARDIAELLTDAQRCALHIVTTPEEMPVNEAIELTQVAQSVLGIALGTSIVNHTVPALSDRVMNELPRIATHALLEAAAKTLAQREAKREAGEADIKRLPAAMLPLVRLPRLVGEHFGRAQLVQLAELVSPVVNT